MTGERADVVVIGAGPAGLAAATELRRAGAGSVVVLDREAEPGGVPRHCNHQGYGLRDMRRPLNGPQYAARWAQIASDEGAELRVRTQATGWTAGGALAVTGPDGRAELRAAATVLATGCRERPRSARLIPGTRPQGVMTTGMLQQLVYLDHRRVGSRAVVVGAEHVSFSALMTLHHGGARAVAMTTEHPRHQSLGAFRAGAAARFRTPLHTRSVVSAIHGRERVDAVEITHLDSGEVQTVECDLIVFTAGWIPDHELAVLGGARLDRGTRGPLVDASLRTTRPGLFAAGNVLHGAETAEVAAQAGRHVAAGVLEHLAGVAWPRAHVPVTTAEPLHWIVPNAVTVPAGPAAVPARGRFLLRAREELSDVRVALEQDGRMIGAEHLRRVMPGRSASLSPAWVEQVDPAGGAVLARVLSARRRDPRRRRARS